MPSNLTIKPECCSKDTTAPGGILPVLRKFLSSLTDFFNLSIIQKAGLGGSDSLVWQCVEHDRLRWGGRVWWNAGRASLPAAGQRGRDVPRRRKQPHSRTTESRSEYNSLILRNYYSGYRRFAIGIIFSSHIFPPSLQVICSQKQQKPPWQPWKAGWLTSSTRKPKKPGHKWRSNSGYLRAWQKASVNMSDFKPGCFFIHSGYRIQPELLLFT